MNSTPELSPCQCGRLPIILAIAKGTFKIFCQCGTSVQGDQGLTLTIEAWNAFKVNYPAVEDEQILMSRLMRKYGLLEKVDLIANTKGIIKELQAECERLRKENENMANYHDQEVIRSDHLFDEAEIIRKERDQLRSSLAQSEKDYDAQVDYIEELQRKLEAAREALKEIEGICLYAKTQAVPELVHNKVCEALDQTNQEMESAREGDFLPKASCAAEEVQQSKQSEQPNAEECLLRIANELMYGSDLIDMGISQDEMTGEDCYHFLFKGKYYFGKTPLEAIRSAMSAMKEQSGAATKEK